MRLLETYEARPGTTIERYVLDNGLVLLLLVDPQAPVFSYQTWFRVGSRHERPGKTGIAHLFEHLMFKETKNTPEGQFDRILEGIGARNNAATWLDWTFYYEDVPAGHLETVMRLEADRMEHMSLTEKQLEAEREVVINERRQRVDNDPGGKLSEVLWDAAFEVHPYGHPTIGWMPDIEGLSLADCLAFYRTYYSPNNAVLVIAGDVDREACLGLVERYYGHLERQAIPTPEDVVEPEQHGVRRKEIELSLTADRLLIGYKAPSLLHPDFPVLELLDEALAEGDSARLQRALVTEGEIATGFSAFVPPFRERGLFEITVELREGRTAEEAEAVVLAELERIMHEGLTDAELEKARNKLETRFVRGLQTAQQRANALGFWEVSGGDFKRLFQQSDRYAAVGREDIVRVAREVLRPDGRTVVIGRPLPDAEVDGEGDDDGTSEDESAGALA
jgi:zinc protease